MSVHPTTNVRYTIYRLETAPALECATIFDSIYDYHRDKYILNLLLEYPW